MLESLKGIEDILLFGLLSASAVLILTSLATAIWLSFRRVYRNKRDKSVQDRQAEFEGILQKLLGTPKLARDIELPPHIMSDRTAITAGLLKFFKLVRGKDSTKLKVIVHELQLEPIIIQATKYGNRGKRMRAQHVLSFLDTSRSLKVISDSLYSDDKYIRLSVARCLARRQVISLISEITEALVTAFPNEDGLLTDVLFRFGADAIPRFEGMIERSQNPTIIAGLLETLILLRPETSLIGFVALSTHADERVRAAAIELSIICKGEDHKDLLLLGLSDDSRMVKIRSLKLAAKSKRSDTFADIYRLMNDPFMWVRYWAMRAALNKGQSGQSLLRTLSKRDNKIGNLAEDVLLES